VAQRTDASSLRAQARTLCGIRLSGALNRNHPMQKFLGRRPRWLTSSFGGSPDRSPAELNALGTHLQDCDRERGRWFALMSFGDALSAFFAPRSISLLVLITLVVGALVAFMI
jgi:hypothetical protein